MAGRTNWYVNHPPACTCVRCERGRAAGERRVRRADRRSRQPRRAEQDDERSIYGRSPQERRGGRSHQPRRAEQDDEQFIYGRSPQKHRGGRSRQPRRVEQDDEGSIYGRSQQKRRGGWRGWLWATAILVVLAILAWYGRDEITSLVSGVQDAATARRSPAAPVAVIAPTTPPTPPNREAAAAPAIPVTTVVTQGSSTRTAEGRLSPTPPAAQPTATPPPPLPTPTPASATPTPASATPTATLPATAATAVRPAATVTATSTATPLPPSPTPTAALPSLREFTNGAWLEQRHARLADSIKTLGWVKDGIDDTEAEAVQDLLYIAVMSRSVTSSLASMPWMRDGVTPGEAAAIGWMNNFSAAEVASAVVALEWMHDGVDDAEVRTLEELSYIANRDAQVGLAVVSLDWVEDGLEDAEVDAIDWIGNISPAEVASAVVALEWMHDGVDATEVTAIRELSYIANRDAQVGLSLISLDWVEDGLDGTEVEAIDWVGNITATGVASSVLSLDWVQDGVEAGEITTIQHLSYLANREPAAAQRIVLMPFLESIEPADTPAIESLWQLAAHDAELFHSIMSHATMLNGITDELAPLVATLEGVAKTDPGLANVVLDPGKVALEKRTIALPLSGDMALIIMRTGPGAARSMDLLEDGVRDAEEFMGVPLPTSFVGLLFERAVTGSFAGTNFGTHIAILPKYDVDDGSREAEFASQSIAHEVAHYYWNGNADWIDEGAAELMAAVSESRRTGRPVGATNYPCAYADNIAGLVSLEARRGAAEFRCNYSLGERLFVDLYATLGDEKFRERFRSLYLASEVEDGDDNRRGTSVDIAHLREAFSSAGDGPETVIARWYAGGEPYDLSRLDSRPVDPSLPSINGMIDEAYVTTSPDGPPTSEFSAGEISDWVYLTLKYSYDVSGDPREVEIDIVEYYEDGFSFRRRSTTLTAEAKYIGGTSWFSVGAYRPRKWATGRYFVYVYAGERKIAGVEYEVTP